MARNDVLALIAAAALVAVSIPAYAEDQQGTARPTNEQRAQQPNRAQDTSSPAGTTSGRAMDRSMHGTADPRTADSASTFDSTYLTPYEVRTPGPRDNIDD